MRVFIAGLSHETNRFSPIPASRRSFEQSALFRPSRLSPAEREAWMPRLRTAAGLGDFIKTAEARGDEVALGLVGVAQPSGPTVRRDYEEMRDELLADLKRAMPVDFVLLWLHGAQIAEGYDDCEGNLLALVRQIIGPKIPVGAELDLHATISEEMLRNATALIACKEYPHTDFPERARELYDIIRRTAEGKLRPVTARRRIPMLSGLHTPSQPARGFIDDVMEMEGRDEVLSISIVQGFSLSDLPDTAANVLVITDNAPSKAEELATELARRYFSLRGRGEGESYSIAEVLDIAAAEPKGNGPVVIGEPGDNPGGGWAGDATFILREMIRRNLKNAANAFLWDPVAVQLASDAGVGSRLSLRIGGKTGPRSGAPLDLEVEVVAVNPTAKQRSFFNADGSLFGPAVALRADGVTIILGSVRTQALSLDCFNELGLDPKSFDIIALKSSQHFYAQFGAIASRVLYCNGVGGVSFRIADRGFKRLRRPIWPLDEIEYDGTERPEA